MFSVCRLCGELEFRLGNGYYLEELAFAVPVLGRLVGDGLVQKVFQLLIVQPAHRGLLYRAKKKRPDKLLRHWRWKNKNRPGASDWTTQNGETKEKLRGRSKIFREDFGLVFG